MSWGKVIETTARTGSDAARPAASLYRKRPLPCRVEFAPCEGMMQTLEGPVRYLAGDALLTGSAGERWPVPRARFLATYAPVPPLCMGEPGDYIKQPVIVSARQVISEEESIELPDGRGHLAARPGDWVVCDADGRQWVVAAAIFDATYECVPAQSEGTS